MPVTGIEECVEYLLLFACDGIFSRMKGRWSDVQGLLSEDNPPGDSNGERACHTEGNSALSLLGTEELTVGVPGGSMHGLL